MISFEYILPPLGLLLIILYYIWFLYKYYKHPHQVSLSINIIARRAWAKRVMNGDKSQSIETLRYHPFEILIFFVPINFEKKKKLFSKKKK